MVVDEEIAKIMSKLEEHEKRISIMEKVFQTSPEAVKKRISIKEFILSKKAKGDVQRTLSIGYYLEKYEAFSSFDVRDLEKGFRDAKEKVPNNINLCVIANIKKGHMMEAKEKKDRLKAWVLTNSGEEHVESGLKKEK
jgi:hypothetical protein